MIGKIARLPRDIREQLNCRLAEGEPGIRLVAWLNELSGVQQVLAEDFGGMLINGQNLTNWRQGGYQEWVKEKQVREICVVASTVPEAVPTLKQLTTLMAGRYLVMMRRRDKPASPEKNWEEWRTYCHDLMKFRRIEIQAQRLELDMDRLEFNREKLVEEKKTVAGRVVEVLLALGETVAPKEGSHTEAAEVTEGKLLGRNKDLGVELGGCPPSLTPSCTTSVVSHK